MWAVKREEFELFALNCLSPSSSNSHSHSNSNHNHNHSSVGGDGDGDGDGDDISISTTYHPYSLPIVETSGKNGKNVKKLFHILGQLILNNGKEKLQQVS